MTTKFDIAANPSLKQLVYEKLQQMIIRGELKPGERLTEEDLSQAMNISRAPIREALNMLERDGFTKIIPRKGAIVAEVSVKDSLDIWKCRLALEPFAAKEACRNIPKDKVAMALVHIQELERQYDFEKYIASDLEVHELYYTYLDNPYMLTILNNLKAHSIRMRWLQENQHQDMRTPQVSMQEHKKILEAFLHDDENGAYAAVQEHIRNSSTRLFVEKKSADSEAQKEKPELSFRK